MVLTASREFPNGEPFVSAQRPRLRVLSWHEMIDEQGFVKQGVTLTEENSKTRARFDGCREKTSPFCWREKSTGCCEDEDVTSKR